MKEGLQFVTKKWWAWLILFILVVIVSSIINTIQKDAVTASEQQKNQENQPEIINSVIGKPLVINDLTFTVNSIERMDHVGKDSSLIKAKGEFIVLDIEIQNGSKRAIITDPTIFKLVKQDIQFESDGSAGVHLNEGQGFYMQLLNPGLTLKGKIAFDLPKGTTPLELQIIPGQNTTIGIVNLEK